MEGLLSMGPNPVQFIEKQLYKDIAPLAPLAPWIGGEEEEEFKGIISVLTYLSLAPYGRSFLTYDYALYTKDRDNKKKTRITNYVLHSLS